MKNMNATAHCQSGEWSGESCTWRGDAAGLLRVEYVPAWQRDTATAAGGWAGLTSVVHVCPACAEQMRECDADWCEVEHAGNETPTDTHAAARTKRIRARLRRFAARTA